MTDLSVPRPPAPAGRATLPRSSRTARGLSVALAAVAAAAAALTVWLPGVLTGPPVMNGSARGTAVVILVAAVPSLVAAMLAGRGVPHGNPATMVWVGSVAYLLYNAVMLTLATPFNSLFLLYDAMLGLAFWSLVVLLVSALRAETTAPVAVLRRDRWVAGFVLAIVALNALAWLSAIVPATFAERPAALLDGTGLTTNPVYVQDLALWLPALTVAAVLLWRRHAWGRLLVGAGLVLWTLEAVGVAVDQWFGHRADPASAVASLGAVWLFAGLAVATLAVTVAHLRAR